MDHSAVTVGIPAYNHERFIDETLEAVAAQTYPNLELVIIDDGSSDGTFARIEAFVERNRDRFGWVHAVTRPNKGVAATMNEIIEAARTEWIFFSASDDVMYPQRIERQLQAIRDWNDPDLALVSGNVDWIDCQGNKIPDLHGKLSNTGIHHKAYEELFIKNNVFSPSVAIRRAAVIELGGFDQSLFFEDWDMWLRLSVRSPIARMAETLGAYRRHESNLSGKRLAMYEGTFMTLGKFLDVHGDLVPVKVGRRSLRGYIKELKKHHDLGPVAAVWMRFDRLTLRYRRAGAQDYYRYARIVRSRMKSASYIR